MRAPLLQIRAPAAYLQFSGLSFDGRGTYAYEAALIKHGVHHVRFLNNDISNMSAAGIATISTDYMTFAGNRIYRFGEGVGWSSGISLNSNAGAFRYDAAPGFHNVLANNIIAGGVDNSKHHSDGNGIILDLGGRISATLIANNIVYMNGGRGIVTVKTSGSVYVVNNTMYKNGLDLRMTGIAEAVAQASSNQVWANNIAYAWEPRFTYQLLDGSTRVMYIRDAHFGGKGTHDVPSTASGEAVGIVAADPLFVSAPPVDPVANGQWRNAPPPWRVPGAFALQRASPFVDAGVDPRRLPGLAAAKLVGMDRWVMRSIDGTIRPAGEGFDYGAYER
jgi:Right handed beta helix region